MVVDKINSFLSESREVNDPVRLELIKNLFTHCFQRQFLTDKKRDSGKLYLSSCGKCPRQLAYSFHDYEPLGKTIDSRSRITFFVGDTLEIMTTQLAQISGCDLTDTGFEQKTVSVIVEGKEVFGHPDGILDKNILFECKSMSSFAFKDFEKGEIDDDYLAQVNIYMHALGLKKCVIVAVCKDSGVLGEQVINYDENIAKLALENMALVLKSTKENLPKGRYTFDEKTGFYPFNCLYCGFWGHCKPNAKKVVVKNAYKLKEKGETK